MKKNLKLGLALLPAAALLLGFSTFAVIGPPKESLEIAIPTGIQAMPEKNSDSPHEFLISPSRTFDGSMVLELEKNSYIPGPGSQVKEGAKEEAE